MVGELSYCCDNPSGDNYAAPADFFEAVRQKRSEQDSSENKRFPRCSSLELNVSATSMLNCYIRRSVNLKVGRKLGNNFVWFLHVLPTTRSRVADKFKFQVSITGASTKSKYFRRQRSVAKAKAKVTVWSNELPGMD